MSQTMRAHREQGFSLVELMVVVVASSIVIAGAFALHTTFNRQNDRMQRITDVQQTLRVARQYVERQLRKAGAGMGSGTFQLRMNQGGGCRTYTIGGVQFHNLNAYPNPVPDEGHLTEDDPDPDWFQFAYMDVTTSPATIDAATSTSSEQVIVNNIAALSGMLPCNTIVNLGQPGGYTCTYGIKQQQGTGSNHININPHGCPNNPCWADTSELNQKFDQCLCSPSNPDFASFSAPYTNKREACDKFAAGMPILSMGPGLRAVRLIQENESTLWAPTGSGASSFPFKLLAYGSLDGEYMTWEKLTDLVEDLQFEIFLNNGTVVGSRNNRRDLVVPDPPTILDTDPRNELPKIRAVRYTIVGRTRSRIEPVNSSGVSPFKQTIPPYADRNWSTNGVTFTDGYLRRMVQGTVQLRNFGL